MFTDKNLNYKDFTFKVDLIDRNSLCVADVKQEDTNVLFYITVTKRGRAYDLTGKSITLFVRKPDGRLVFQDSDLQITDAKAGKLTINMKNSAFQVAGTVVCNLDFRTETEYYTSANFFFHVGEKIGDNSATESHIDVPLYWQVADYLDKAVADIEKYKSLVEAFSDAGVSVEGLHDIKDYVDSNIGELTAQNNRAEKNIAEAKEVNSKVETSTETATGVKADLDSLIKNIQSFDFIQRPEFTEHKTAFNNHKHDNLYATKGEFNDLKEQVAENRPIIITDDMPIGSIVYQSKNAQLPSEWLWCDGSFVAVSDYPELYRAIGNTHGGDSTRFKLPLLIAGDNLVNTGAVDGSNEIIMNEVKGQQGIIKARNLSSNMLSIALEVDSVRGNYSTLKEALVDSFASKEIFALFGQSDVAGFLKLSSEIILQWGEVSVGAETFSINKTFPIAFPNNCLNVSITQKNADYSFIDFSVVEKDSTKFTMQTSKDNAVAFWFAIGY